MKNLNVYYDEAKKRGMAIATAFTLMFTPVLAGETKAEGLEGLLDSYGVETEKYTKKPVMIFNDFLVGNFVLLMR